MNGSRSAPTRHGDRSSLDALNRTIEGLEARIEGLMSGTARDVRQPRSAHSESYPDTREDRRPVESRRTAGAPYRAAEFSSDPLAEIRDRQRVLESSRDRSARPDLRQSFEPRRNEQRPPEAYRQDRVAPARAPSARYAEPRAAAPAARHEEAPRGQETRRPIPEPRRSAPAASQDGIGMQDIAQALVSLRQDLKRDIGEGVAREMSALRSEIRAIKTVAEDQRFNDDLRGDLARLAEGIDQLGYQATPEAAGLRAEFEELRTAMDGMAREDSVRRMESRWQGLEERIVDFDTTALRGELVSLAYRIDEIKGQLGKMSDSPVIRALEQKLISVAGAMEQLGSRMQPTDGLFAEQFATLDQRLDEISRAIAAGSRASASASLDQPFLQRLDDRIGALADQIDLIGQATRRQADPTEALSARIEALTGRIEELADEHAAIRLEERLEQLSLILEQVQKPAHEQDLSAHLSDISRKIDGLERGSVNDELAERLDYLARRIDEMDHQPRIQPAADQQAFTRIEDRLSDIATRLDEATAAPRNDDSALRGLEEQIAHLSVLISQPQAAGGSLPADFENRMASIESHMATNDEYIIEAARHAAETVLEAYSRNMAAGTPVAAGDMAALAALANDLRYLEDLTRSSEERTHQTFEALHGTLVQIADRLDGMDQRLSAAPRSEAARFAPQPEAPDARRATPAMPSVAQLSVAQPHADADEEAMREDLSAAALNDVQAGTFGTRERVSDREPAPAASARIDMSDMHATMTAIPEAAKPSLLTELSRRFMPGGKDEMAKSGRAVVEPTPSIDPSDVLPPDHENDLIEPGSGAPDVKKILERVRASQAAGEFDTDRASGTARADYIAAARRAAKAAAQETDPSQATAPAKGPRKAAKPAAGKGLGARFFSYRRPILMAVGAVLLALAAMPLARTLTGDTEAPSAALPTEQIEAPTLPQVSAAMSGGTQRAPAQNEAATDGADEAQGSTPPQQEPQSRTTANPLTDPRPVAGQPSAMERADAPSKPQDSFVAAPKAEATPPIVVPPGIEPKSLADAAAAGDPNALFEIGARFTDGRGVKTDLSEAANWYKLAADRGLAPAQYRLANLFEKGTGVQRDINRAITYYKQAADAGNASAMHNLAVLYASGAAGQPDYAAAVNWFGKAADLGVADSQFNLAILFARGNGAKQDLEQSYKWFAVAAKDGDKDAAQKRDEVANAMRKEQLESARAKVDQWKVQPLDPKANAVNLPDEWASGKPLTTASVDMEKAIRNIQAILNKNGFDAGAPDGKLGAKTVTAIKAFQTSVGQEPNGKINDALVKELLARNK